MRNSLMALVALAWLTASADEEPPVQPPPTAVSEAPEPPVPLNLQIAVRLQPKDDKHHVVVEGVTNLPDRTIVECHLYATYGNVGGRERANFIDGRSAVVEKGKCRTEMGPYAIAIGTYRVEAVVDGQRQYPNVKEALQKAGLPQIRALAETRFGTDEEITEEREIGRTRMLHSAERIQTLLGDLLAHSRDLQGPLDRGDWEGAWLAHLKRLRGRLFFVPGKVVGQNQMSRPLSEQYDHTETALLDCVRAMLKAYRTLAKLPDAAEQGEAPPWPDAVAKPLLDSLLAKATDTLVSDYQQDILIRLEGILRNARAAHQAAAVEEDPPKEAAANPEAPPIPRGPPPKQLWAAQQPQWLAECKALKEELSLLTDEGSPRPFVKQLAKRLLPIRDRALALTADVETVVQGLGRALSAGKPPADEVAAAIDAFYKGHAEFVLISLGGGSP